MIFFLNSETLSLFNFILVFHLTHFHVSIIDYYLVQLIRTTNRNLKFLQRNFCLFTF
jgi:hypothetical protein